MDFRDYNVTLDERKNVCFQVIDWYHFDHKYDDSDNNKEENIKYKYVIKMFGVTEEGHSLCANVCDFQPYFFISTDSKFSISEIETIGQSISKQLPKNFKNAFQLKKINKKSIWGFTNNTPKQYIKVTFDNLMCMYIVRKMLQKTLKIHSRSIKFQFHESNIDPFLRFIHTQNIKPGGWVMIDDFSLDVEEEFETKCQINLQTSFQNVTPHECNKVAPVYIMSFDIECTSHSGDFPVPIKTYKKTAEEIIDMYKYFNQNNLLSTKTPWFLKNAIIKNIAHIFQDTPDFQSKFDSFFESEIYHAKTHNISFTKVVTKKKKINLDNIFINIHKFVHDIIDILLEEKNVTNRFISEYPDVEPTMINQIEHLLNDMFPPLKGDSIIQIGSTVHRYGETVCSYKNIITLDTCDDIPGVDVITCKTETALLKEWCKLIHKIDPDIITGYNILGFDFEYIYKRALELGCEFNILQCSRLENHTSKYIEKMLASSALGENVLKYVMMEGRVFIDLMKVVQREYKLDSYKLDNVASHFISGKVVTNIDQSTFTLDSIAGINVGDYIKLNDTHKTMVTHITDNTVTINSTVEDTVKSWGLAKDDVSPKEIFACQKGSSADRAKIAKYCVQDCALCNMLIIKLEVFANNIGMANVCLVPLSYIFMRGQGIKIFSLVAKQCKDDNFIIPLIKYDEDSEESEGYEGAIVLDPIPGIYVDAPISVMDYASLYPSSMISENISHDSIVIDPKYDNLPGIDYVDITYDIFNGVGDKKVKVDEKTCRYAQFKNNEKGVLPRILMKLLSQRKATRKQILHKTITTSNNEVYTGLVTETDTDITIKTADNNVTVMKTDVVSNVDTYNDFMKAILDGLQLAYKITANSLYGQVGARTSPIYMKELAASTTATGRNLIIKAKHFMEKHYDADVVYGDTDSIFVDFKIKEKYGLVDKEALQKSIDISVEASDKFKKELKDPHDLEYEKTFFPFIILSKKKYVGNLYEFDVNKYKQKSMGIVLKRRDNANIVKIVYGGIIDILLKKQNISNAIEFLKTSLKRLTSGDFKMEDLVITKTLRTTYKDPSKIAHKVLADRMRDRDPGSAPQTSDRVPYVYIEHDVKNKSLLQGDKIEHPSYILENNLNIDYIFYITNQLMKPICQLLSVALHDIPKSSTPELYSRKLKRYTMDYDGNLKKAKDKVNDLKQKEVQKLLFDDTLTKLNNKRNKNTEITDFFLQID